MAREKKVHNISLQILAEAGTQNTEIDPAVLQKTLRKLGNLQIRREPHQATTALLTLPDGPTVRVHAKLTTVNGTPAITFPIDHSSIGLISGDPPNRVIEVTKDKVLTMATTIMLPGIGMHHITRGGIADKNAYIHEVHVGRSKEGKKAAKDLDKAIKHHERIAKKELGKQKNE